MTSVDAVMGTIQAHEPSIKRCLETLIPQVRQAFVVLDGWGYTGPLDDFQATYEDGKVTLLHRRTRHGPAASFNHGAKQSTADWLLYVDPHNIYRPGSIHQMIAAAGDLDFVLGTGDTTWLSPDDPWAPALSRYERSREPVPLTFLMRRALWEEMGGIPEPPYCHMEVLADELLRRGVQIARLGGMVTHSASLSLQEYAAKHYMSGYSYAALAATGSRIGESADVVRLARELDRDQVTQLLGLAFTALHQLGAVAGLGGAPGEALPVDDFRCQWLGPKEDESDDS
jgi:hypothetical protein